MTINNNTSKRGDQVIQLQPYSNIMTIVPFAKIVTRELEKIETGDIDIDIELLKEEIIPEPVLATVVDYDYEDLPVTPLEDLFLNQDKSSNTFRARFYVIRATPADEVIQPANKKLKIKEHFECQFLVKDPSTSLDSSVYKIYLYTAKDKGNDFFGNLKATSKGALKKIDQSLQTLTRFNVHVDAIVERSGGAYFIKDTILKDL